MKENRCNNQVYISIFLSILLTLASDYFYDKYLLNEKIKVEKNIQIIKYIDKQLNEFYTPLELQLLESERKWIRYKNRYNESDIFLDISRGVENSDTREWKYKHKSENIASIHFPKELIKLIQKDIQILKDKKKFYQKIQ